MENGILIALGILAIIEIILFVKIWQMTNNVSKIHMLLSGQSGIQYEWGHNNIDSYCRQQIKRAKRMNAIGEDGAVKILKALLYDLYELHNPEVHDPYMQQIIKKYEAEVQQVLAEMQK